MAEALTGIGVALIQWGVIAYGVWRVSAAAEAIARRCWPDTPLPDVPIPLPQDLLAVALSHNEEWAQEEVMKAMRERYALTQDWNVVRQAFGVGMMPDQTGIVS